MENKLQDKLAHEETDDYFVKNKPMMATDDLRRRFPFIFPQSQERASE